MSSLTEEITAGDLMWHEVHGFGLIGFRLFNLPCVHYVDALGRRQWVWPSPGWKRVETVTPEAARTALR